MMKCCFPVTSPHYAYKYTYMIVDVVDYVKPYDASLCLECSTLVLQLLRSMPSIKAQLEVDQCTSRSAIVKYNVDPERGLKMYQTIWLSSKASQTTDQLLLLLKA